MESIQYKVVQYKVARTGTMRNTSGEKLYQELGLESFRKRRW